MDSEVYFGQWLSKCRKEMKLSNSKFADLLELHPSTVKNIMLGHRGCTVYECQRICARLGVDLNLSQFKVGINVKLLGWKEHE